MEDLVGEGTTALHRTYEHVADIRTSLGIMFPNQEKLYYICGDMRVAKHDVVCCKQWILNHDQRKAALVYGPQLVPDARNDVPYPGRAMWRIFLTQWKWTSPWLSRDCAFFGR
jgi:hypothetical protein